MDPLEELDRATARYQSLQDAQTQVQLAIAAALKAGKRPSEVARRSPFTPAYVRRIARASGIEGDQRYVRDVRRTTRGEDTAPAHSLSFEREVIEKAPADGWRAFESGSARVVCSCGFVSEWGSLSGVSVLGDRHVAEAHGEEADA